RLHCSTCADTGTFETVSLPDLIFFFSSRRRHTRSKRDWSSDVCSSDLTPERDILWGDGPGYHFGESVTWCDMKHISESGTQVERSEERRVGKEGGGGWGSGYESEKEPERWGRGDGKAQGRGGGSWHGTT